MSGAILVRDIMTKDVKTANPNTSVMTVVRKMNKFNIGSIIVVQRGRPIGIITERDILRRIIEQQLDPSVVRVKQVMSSPPITIQENATIEEAANLMTKKMVKKLPVVNNDRLIGIVTATDIVKNAPKMATVFNEYRKR